MHTTKHSGERDFYRCSNCSVEFVDPIAEMNEWHQEWAQCPRCFSMSFNLDSTPESRELSLFGLFDSWERDE